jgi:hypothetical protein
VATTLTATALPDLAAVRLEVTGGPNGPLLITRNGVPVRQPANTIVSAGLAVITDYEPPLSGPLVYETADTLGGTVTATLAELPPPAGGVLPVLMVTTHPAQRVTAPLIGYGEQTPSTSTVHAILDSGTPVPVLGPLGTRRASLTFLCSSYAQAAAVRELLRPRSVALFRHPVEGLDTFATLGDTAVAMADVVRDPATGQLSRYWTATVETIETDRPTADLDAAAGWTWADVLAGYATWSAVGAAFPTWHDVAVGP